MIPSTSPVRNIITRPACYPRRKFASKDSAAAAGRNIAANRGVHRLPEPCSKCNGWHLSSGK